EGITGLDLTIDAELLQHAPNLKIISNVSVGYNNLDLDLMTKHNIMGTNTPSVLTDTVADLGFALLMASARRLPELDHYVKIGKWNNDLTAEYYGIDIHHKTIGIIIHIKAEVGTFCDSLSYISHADDTNCFMIFIIKQLVSSAWEI